MCIGGPGPGAGPGAFGDPGSFAGSASGNFSGIGSPPGTIGVPTVSTADAQGGSLGDLHGGWDTAGQAAGNQGLGYGGATAPLGASPNTSDIAAMNIGKTILTTLATIFGASTLPVSAGLFAANQMAKAARGAGQLPGEISPSIAVGAGPGGLGGPGDAVTFGSLTGVANPILRQQGQLPASEPRPVAMPVGNITSSLFSVPPPKVNIGNLMAARGVRDVGTKTALPEWFTKGKRGY